MTLRSFSLFCLSIAWFAVSSHANCGSCSPGAASGEMACSDQQLASYFQAQEGLASDDLAAAKKGAESLLAKAESASCSVEKDCGCAKELTAAESIVDASDISAARLAFKDWSDALVAKVEKAGLDGAVAYEMHCPMAFNNTGGTWLQASKDLRNPYYGAMMLTCGMQTGAFGEAEAADSCCGSGAPCCSEKKASCCDS